MQNKRSERRETTTWPGRIAFERGAQLRECIVRDISKAGARLTLANPRLVPDEFELLILTTGEILPGGGEMAPWPRARGLFRREGRFPGLAGARRGAVGGLSGRPAGPRDGRLSPYSMIPKSGYRFSEKIMFN